MYPEIDGSVERVVLLRFGDLVSDGLYTAESANM